MLCDTSEHASVIYDKASRLPRTSTRLALKQKNGIQIDGSFPANSSKASFCYAFLNGCPLVLKLYDNQLNANREKEVAKRIGNQEACTENNLVFLFSIEVLTENSPLEALTARLHSGSLRPSPFFALASPVYVMTLDKWPSPMYPRDLSKMGRQMLIALTKLHSLKICHNDIKPDNIFIDQNGNFFLGDFGACETMGAVIQEFTRDFMPECITHCSKFSDYALLKATILKQSGITIPSTSTVEEYDTQCRTLMMKLGEDCAALLSSALFLMDPIEGKYFYSYY